VAACGRTAFDQVLEPRNIPGTVVRGFARTFRQCIVSWVIARSFSDVCDFAVVGWCAGRMTSVEALVKLSDQAKDS
jgi:hypothetical protein